MKMNETHTQRKRKSYHPAIMLVAMFALLASGCAETKSSPRFDPDAGADADALGDGGEEPITFDPLETYYRVEGDSGLISERLEEIAEDESLEVRICAMSYFRPAPEDDRCDQEPHELGLYEYMQDVDIEDGPDRITFEWIAQLLPESWEGLPREWWPYNNRGSYLVQVLSDGQLQYEMQVVRTFYPTRDFEWSVNAAALFVDLVHLGNYEIICPEGHYIERNDVEALSERFAELEGALIPTTGTRCVPIPDDFQP